VITELERLVRIPRVEAGNTSYHTPEHARPGNWRNQRWYKWLRRLREIGGTGVSGLRAATAPALETVSDHWMSFAAAGCADWAAFLWNAKSGLITAAVLLVLLEMKVSP
jgi:hypothetical protein